MLFFSLGKDYYIVQIDKGIGQVQLTEAILHEPLEHCRSMTEPVQHPQELIHAHDTHRKGSVLLGFLGHLDLPKTRFQVHCGEEPGSYHGLHSLLHLGKWESILLGPVIQLMKVNAEPESPYFLRTKTTTLH